MRNLIQVEFKMSSILTTLYDKETTKKVFDTLVGKPILENDIPIGYIQEVDVDKDFVKGVIWKTTEVEVLQSYDTDFSGNKVESGTSELMGIVLN